MDIYGVFEDYLAISLLQKTWKVDCSASVAFNEAIFIKAFKKILSALKVLWHGKSTLKA